MKQSFARQHSHQSSRTPSVIYLPPPKPPVTAKRVTEPAPEAAIALPDTTEPLVTERTEVEAPYVPRMSRQARRKALRAEAKALRRQGQPVMPVAQPAEPVAESLAQAMPEPEVAPALAAIEPAPVITEPEIALEPEIASWVVAIEPAAAIAPEPEAAGPLPRARSLVATKPRRLALFAHRLRAIFGLGRASPVPEAQVDGAIASQLRTVRDELAALQRSIDRMIDGVAV